MSLRIVRLGSPRAHDEGLRIGTVRRPPRGVPKAEHGRRDYYDVWLPTLAPSLELLTQGKNLATEPRAWRAFARRFKKEMSAPAPSRELDLLAALSHRTNLSVGCYCEDETRCHRSILRQLLKERGATFA
jgi:uncharacterized protein YeaO (DUF488 family)